MRFAKLTTGAARFNPDEYLSGGQVASFFSRLVKQQRNTVQEVAAANSQEMLEDSMDVEIQEQDFSEDNEYFPELRDVVLEDLKNSECFE